MADYKLKRKNDAQIKERISKDFANDQNNQEKLKKLSEKVKVSEKEKSEKEIMMAKAAEFVENGIPFEMAPKELQDHHFFKVGYEVALRRKKALEMQGNKKIGGR